MPPIKTYQWWKCQAFYEIFNENTYQVEFKRANI